MLNVKSCCLPADALLCRYQKHGQHTDCYVTEIPVPVSDEQFVLAFYTTWLFKVERIILKWVFARPSTDAEAALLAADAVNGFAAWNVEARSVNELLLADFQGRTRSWLMVSPIDGNTTAGTRLYFGSAIVPIKREKAAAGGPGLGYRLLLIFHKFYSVALLAAAARHLVNNNR